jgi:hypothetical protein
VAGIKEMVLGITTVLQAIDELEPPEVSFGFRSRSGAFADITRL